MSSRLGSLWGCVGLTSLPYPRQPYMPFPTPRTYFSYLACISHSLFDYLSLAVSRPRAPVYKLELELFLPRKWHCHKTWRWKGLFDGTPDGGQLWQEVNCKKFLSQQNQCCNATSASDLELWCDPWCYITIFRHVPDYIGWLVWCFKSLKRKPIPGPFLYIGAPLPGYENLPF